MIKNEAVLLGIYLIYYYYRLAHTEFSPVTDYSTRVKLKKFTGPCEGKVVNNSDSWFCDFLNVIFLYILYINTYITQTQNRLG